MKSNYEKVKNKPLWEGSRFKEIAKKAKEQWAKCPECIAYSVWVKKYWKDKMTELAQKAKKKKGK